MDNSNTHLPFLFIAIMTSFGWPTGTLGFTSGCMGIPSWGGSWETGRGLSGFLTALQTNINADVNAAIFCQCLVVFFAGL